MKVVLATRNRKKVEEIRRMATGSLTLLSLNDFPECLEVVEDGATFRANACKKAREVARYTGLTALADDSGLEVDALGGRPGVHSARYAGTGATDRQNLDKLLEELGDRPEDQRTARFVCVLALVDAKGGCRIFDGRVEGRIAFQPRGENGFGYDPVFLPEGAPVTFAEMDPGAKDAMSHRGRALAQLASALNDHSGPILA
ncbi:MAG: XTP/dITP diphosphatase [Magnetococcales bacterium]|nr:XTP/dITP diphosphatase [Magnetococcales bacterium]